MIVLIQPAAIGFKNLLHTAANQFLCLHQETRDVLVEVEDARNLEFHPAVSLHRPGSDLNNESPIFDSQGLAPGGQHRLWPLLHVGLASAR